MSLASQILKDTTIKIKKGKGRWVMMTSMLLSLSSGRQGWIDRRQKRKKEVTDQNG